MKYGGGVPHCGGPTCADFRGGPIQQNNAMRWARFACSVVLCSEMYCGVAFSNVV